MGKAKSVSLGHRPKIVKRQESSLSARGTESLSHRSFKSFEQPEPRDPTYPEKPVRALTINLYQAQLQREQQDILETSHKTKQGAKTIQPAPGT